MKIRLCGLLLAIMNFTHAAGAQERLIYHVIKVDQDGAIKPWYDDNLGKSYDHVLNLVWNFWDTMRTDGNGLPYYMNHQVWRPDFNDSRGLGGDQLQMALSSWRLLYAYTGSERVKQNMKFIADYYITHSLSPSTSRWGDLPFPYNTLIYSGVYDGDMVIGKGFLQPDKAGSLGLELVHLYKMTLKDGAYPTTPKLYLETAIRIARSLIRHLRAGDETHSPLPFKVNAYTGEVGPMLDNNGAVVGLAEYTTNWAPTLEMFLELSQLDPGAARVYQRAYDLILKWMKKYPLKNNKWGPFFEDVAGFSDTQINAVTFAKFMMEHREAFADWRTEVPGIFDWVYQMFGNDNWSSYGVTVVNEQTSYQVPGQSHVARQGETELQYCALSGDMSRKVRAIRQLNWATYMVDNDGKNRFPTDENWLTDGYGDYVRHYLRAMADFPDLAPPAVDHLLASTSVIQQSDYRGQINKFQVPYVKYEDLERVRVYYRAFDPQGRETLRLAMKPTEVQLDGRPLPQVTDADAVGWRWAPIDDSSGGGGTLEVTRDHGVDVVILDGQIAAAVSAIAQAGRRF